MNLESNLRETIIKISSELFMKQSYAATSVQQIADTAGCTKAALYYYFKDGKESILREVIDYTIPDLTGLLEPVRNASSLHDLSLQLGLNTMHYGRDVLRKTRWLMADFPNINLQERAKLHRKFLEFQQGLADLIEPFVDSRRTAEMIAWVQFSALFGYGQLFITLDLASAQEPLTEEYVSTLADIVGLKAVTEL